MLFLMSVNCDNETITVHTWSCDNSGYFDTKRIDSEPMLIPEIKIVQEEQTIQLIQEVDSSEAEIHIIKVEQTLFITMCGTFDHSGIFSVSKIIFREFLQI